MVKEMVKSIQYLSDLRCFPSKNFNIYKRVKKEEEMTLTMLLASGDVLGPVAGVSLLVVEEAADAELLSGGAVPAGPVAGAGGLVPEDAVEPVAVLGGDGGVWVGGGRVSYFSWKVKDKQEQKNRAGLIYIWTIIGLWGQGE